MARNALARKLILMIVALGFLFAGRPIDVTSSQVFETPKNQETARGDDSQDAGDREVAVQLSRDEIDSITTALPDGEVRQMFKKKASTGAQMDTALAGDKPVEGEEIATLFFDSEKAFSRVQEQIRAFFTKPTSTIDSREWTVVWQNLTQGKGLGYLVLTFFIVALLIFCGLAMEWLVRRCTEGLRRQILDRASLGRLQFLGRVFSRLLLNLLGIVTYMLTTFVLFAVFYDEGDPGFIIVSMTLILSYYMRLAILAANLVLSPAAPALERCWCSCANLSFRCCLLSSA